MKIVGVRPARQSRVTLLTESGEEILLDKKTWEESPFGVDSSLSDTELCELVALSERNRARNKAVFLLSRRDYSQRELAQKLCREKGRYYADRREAAEEAAAYMQELGYVNDEAYARHLAQRYHRERLYPRRRVIQTLTEKGIDRVTAETAVQELSREDWELALELLYKKRYNVSDDAGERDKAAAALARFGFSGEDIRRAIRAWQEAEVTDEY